MDVLKQIEQFFSARIALIKTMCTMMQLEARLAALSIFPLLISICLLLIILMTSWLLISLLVGYGILLFSNNFLLSLFLVFLLNVVLLLCLVKYLAFNLKNMSFEKTRAYFSQNKSIDDEQFEKTVKVSNSNDEQRVAATTNSGSTE